MNPSKENSYAKIRQKAADFWQEHLFAFWDELNSPQQEQLLGEVASIDFERIRTLFASATTSDDWPALARRAEPPEAFRLDGRGNRIAADDARAAGEAALRREEVGAVLVAGGQGTRMGFDKPKGMYPIGPVSQATLFQILFEKLLAVGHQYRSVVPLFLMTSDATHVATQDYLEEVNRFGIPAGDVKLFRQGALPAVDAASGRVLLAEKNRVALSPDGHGGMLAALERSGSLEDIGRRGIKYLFYCQVDNPLVVMCDPLFLGYHILSQSEMSTLAIAKRYATERVGNVVRIEGRTQVIEYSDFPLDVAEQRDAEGLLRFWAGSIAIHVFDAAFLQRCADARRPLPYHVARKKVAFVDERGHQVEPGEQNALKFEQFIFDLLPWAQRPIVVETDAARTFAPVKNVPGAQQDSPDTCRAAMIALHREWLEAAGAKLSANTPVEISPLFASDAAQVRMKIKPGTIIDRPTYFDAD